MNNNSLIYTNLVMNIAHKQPNLVPLFMLANQKKKHLEQSAIYSKKLYSQSN